MIQQQQLAIYVICWLCQLWPIYNIFRNLTSGVLVSVVSYVVLNRIWLVQTKAKIGQICNKKHSLMANKNYGTSCMSISGSCCLIVGNHGPHIEKFFFAPKAFCSQPTEKKYCAKRDNYRNYRFPVSPSNGIYFTSTFMCLVSFLLAVCVCVYVRQFFRRYIIFLCSRMCGKDGMMAGRKGRCER